MKPILCFKEVKMNNSKGWRTSEFWLHIVTIAATIFAFFANKIPADLMVKIVLASSSVYSIARAIVKFTPSKKDDAFLDEVANIVMSKIDVKQGE
jgi:hypothetical protein